MTQWNTSVDEDRGARADQDRRDRERQRAQPRRADPVAEGRLLDVPRIAGLVHLLRVAARGLLARTGTLALLAGGACHEVTSYGLSGAFARTRDPPGAPTARQAENGGMLSIGSIVLTVEDITRAGDFWRAALGYVNRAPSVGGLGHPRPARQGDVECARREPRAVGHRVPAALSAPHPSRSLRRGPGRRDRAPARRSARGRSTGTATPTTRTRSCSKTPRATASASSTPGRSRPPDHAFADARGRTQCSAATAARIASRSGLPLGSVANSSTSTSRVGRACAPTSSATAARASSSCTDSLRRSASPRGTTTTDASPHRSSGDADDDGGLEAGDRADDPLHAVERDVDPARDDDVVDPAAHAQQVVLDDPGVVRCGTTGCRRRLGGTRHPSLRSRRGSRRRGSDRRPAPRRRPPAPTRLAGAGRRTRSRRWSRSRRTSGRRGRRHPAPARGSRARSPDRRRGSSRTSAARPARSASCAAASRSFVSCAGTSEVKVGTRSPSLASRPSSARRPRTPAA